ncbi:hypothetical protein RB9532 [Rhodopirellula baltica SH 1]|uniref:Uncharacterized protein n=1 Tax=Rhodopirellula baltica (strain DSM 10527 / NCIMB 13988 / SH1) TaxID=243090 RepID=Q7ULF8_RHOBA|nr:hypothetical protein RB9532 [Rhodopirellula baltica SH 1]
MIRLPTFACHSQRCRNKIAPIKCFNTLKHFCILNATIISRTAQSKQRSDVEGSLFVNNHCPYARVLEDCRAPRCGPTLCVFRCHTTFGCNVRPKRTFTKHKLIE